jgi:hypothetical protein
MPLSVSRDLPGGGVLVNTEKGLFLARVVNDAVTVDRAGNAETERVLAMHDLPGGAVLIGALKGLKLKPNCWILPDDVSAGDALSDARRYEPLARKAATKFLQRGHS